MMIRHLYKRLLLAAMILLPSAINAKISLPPLFTDNMVLQQQSIVKIWGKASADKLVTVKTSWNEAVYSVKADHSGSWVVEVKTIKAGGPYSISISDETEVVLNNVLLGEVWICSGQSNMEMKVSDKVLGWEKELPESSKYTNIRLLHVENRISPVPMDNVEIRYGGWQNCSPSILADFSATAWFFGKELNTNLNVPIGLIESCWGGTLAEAWTSAESLLKMPYFVPKVESVKSIPATNEARMDLFDKEIDQWRKDMAAVDKGFSDGKPIWADASFDDSSWKEYNVPGYIQEQSEPDFGGFLWMRKSIDIPKSWENCELTLDLAAIDDNDFTYFNGVEVGHVEGCMVFRRYKVPASLVKAGKAVISIRVMDTGGLGGIAGTAESMKIYPSGKESINISGAWKYQTSLTLAQAPEIPLNTALETNIATFLYNAMINPLINYKIAGAIWYQGEANVARAAQYADLMPLMINDWREKWGYTFPFYIVQLANYMKVQEGAEESEWAELREAQASTLHLENTGMAVIIDIGEEKDIHPKNKSEVGHRLAIAALAQTYGEDIPYSGPLYDSYKIENGTIRISFKHTDNGLKIVGGNEIKGFYIAGVDHIFHQARAIIDGDTVIVSSEQVDFPVAVRYGWANNPICNLYNGVGLPTGPFRTDRW